MKKFLIIQTAFLGDVVLMTAVVEKLHLFFPDAQIDVVIRRGNEGVFGARTLKSGNRTILPLKTEDKGYSHSHPFAKQVFVWDKTAAKKKNLFNIIGAIRNTHYDHVINCQRFFSTGLITMLSRSKEKVGYAKNPLSFFFRRKVKHNIGDGRHEVDRLNDLIDHLTDGNRPLPKLHPTSENREQVERLLAPGFNPTLPSDTNSSSHGQFITIAPASVWFTKQWPKEKWVELMNTRPAGCKVLLIGGPSDKLLCGSIKDEAGHGRNLAGDLSLLATAVLMEKATMNYVNDSAPLHIASAMQAPVTAVYCSTVPAFGFGPLNENGQIVETQEKLACRPCGLHGKSECPEGHFKCAKGILMQQLTP